MIDRQGNMAFVRQARESDIDRIYEIAVEQSATRNSVTGRIVKSGLISDYGKDLYRECINSASYFLVSLQNSVITSFLLAFSNGDHAPEQVKLDAMSELINRNRPANTDSFILVKQIATAKKYAGRWHARILYQALKSLSKPSPIYAAIVISPPNVPSIRLHEHAG